MKKPNAPFSIAYSEPLQDNSGMLIAPIVAGIISVVSSVVDKAVPDRDKAAELKAEFEKQINQYSTLVLQGQIDIITAEAKGESPVQRNWRPHLMYFLMFLIGFNVVLVPLVSVLVGVQIPVLEAWSSVTDPAWTLLQIGMGGYIVGRSAEKIVSTYKGTK